MRKDKHFLAFTNQAAAVMVFADGKLKPCQPNAVRQCSRSKSCPFVPRANFLPVCAAAQPARRPATLLYRPGQESRRSRAFYFFL